MKSLFLSIFVVFSMVSTLSMASGYEVYGECGDHYFRVEFSADAFSHYGSILLTGDSGGQKKSMTEVREEAGGMILTTKDGAYLRIDERDHGYYSVNGKVGTEINLGKCEINRPY